MGKKLACTLRECEIQPTSRGRSSQWHQASHTWMPQWKRFSSPKVCCATVERMPSAPTSRSASQWLPSSKWAVTESAVSA